MAEELRFFLRISLFTGGAAAVYWFVSYETVGTILLAGVAIAGAAFIAAVWSFADPERSPHSSKAGGAIGRLDRWIGFAEDESEEALGALEMEEEPIPPSSIWPLGASLALMFAGLGAAFGTWFFLPAAALGAVAMWGWMTEMRPR